MKLFFKKILSVIKTLVDGSADKHQKWLMYGTLIFGLIISLLLGTISSILLMAIVALCVELIYCFVPTTCVNWHDYWFKIPDFKEFKTNMETYMMSPIHAFDVNNFLYVLISIVLFIVLRILFLIF